MEGFYVLPDNETISTDSRAEDDLLQKLDAGFEFFGQPQTSTQNMNNSQQVPSFDQSYNFLLSRAAAGATPLPQHIPLSAHLPQLALFQTTSLASPPTPQQLIPRTHSAPTPSPPSAPGSSSNNALSISPLTTPLNIRISGFGADTPQLTQQQYAAQDIAHELPPTTTNSNKNNLKREREQVNDDDSDGDGDEPEKTGKRKERLREASRSYRKRRKEHIEDLESKVAQLTQENEQLNKTINELRQINSARLKSEGLANATKRFREGVEKLQKALETGCPEKDIARQVEGLLTISREIENRSLLSHILKVDFTQICNRIAFGSDLDPVASLEIYLGMHKDSGISEQTLRKVYPVLSDFVLTRVKCTEDIKRLNQELVVLVRKEVIKRGELTQEIGMMASIINVIGEIQKVYIQGTESWTLFKQRLRELLSPSDMARLVIQRHKLAQSMGLLNTIWFSMNRQHLEGEMIEVQSQRVLLPAVYTVLDGIASSV